MKFSQKTTGCVALLLIVSPFVNTIPAPCIDAVAEYFCARAEERIAE